MSELGWIIRPSETAAWWVWTSSEVNVEGARKADWQVIEVADAAELREAREAWAEWLDATNDLRRLEGLPVSEVYAERGEPWRQFDDRMDGLRWANESSERVWGPPRERVETAWYRLSAALATAGEPPAEPDEGST